MRTVKTSSGATAVQVVWSWRKGSRSIEHLGSAHDEVELAALKAASAGRMSAGQTELDLGIAGHLEPGTLPILSSQMTALWDALCAACGFLGFEWAPKVDAVVRDLVLARIMEPNHHHRRRTGTERSRSRPGVVCHRQASPARLRPTTAGGTPWPRPSAAHAGLGPASLVLFDVSTLYFETDAGDGFRDPGFSKERRLDPQITLGLLTDAAGFPLTVQAFEGNEAEPGPCCRSSTPSKPPISSPMHRGRRRRHDL